jgi:hypothetical protein
VPQRLARGLRRGHLPLELQGGQLREGLQLHHASEPWVVAIAQLQRDQRRQLGCQSGDAGDVDGVAPIECQLRQAREAGGGCGAGRHRQGCREGQLLQVGQLLLPAGGLRCLNHLPGTQPPPWYAAASLVLSRLPGTQPPCWPPHSTPGRKTPAAAWLGRPAAVSPATGAPPPSDTACRCTTVAPPAALQGVGEVGRRRANTPEEGASGETDPQAWGVAAGRPPVAAWQRGGSDAALCAPLCLTAETSVSCGGRHQGGGPGQQALAVASAWWQSGESGCRRARRTRGKQEAGVLKSRQLMPATRRTTVHHMHHAWVLWTCWC